MTHHSVLITLTTFLLAATPATWCPAYAALRGHGSSAPQTSGLPFDHNAECHYKQLSMATMLRDLSKRYGISILADGEPKLPAGDLEYSGSLRQTLDRVADMFDYNLVIGKSGIVTMTKRFKNPDDLPQLNVAEIRQTAVDMLKVLPRVPYDPDPLGFAYQIRRLAQTLNPAQWAELREGKQIALADLPPAQQEAVAGIIRQRAYGMPVAIWETLRRQLEQFDESVLRAEKKGVFNAANGSATAYYDIDHESRGADGVTTKTPIGTFQRSVNR